MIKKELSKALEIASSDMDLSMHDIDIFDGFGLPDFKPVYVTIYQVARLIRWQCQYLDGSGMDSEALQEIAYFGKKRFLVV